MPTQSKTTIVGDTVELTTVELTNCFAMLKENQCFRLDKSEKIFKKMAGLVVATNMDDYTWIKSRVSEHFFNTYVGRVVYVRMHARNQN